MACGARRRLGRKHADLGPSSRVSTVCPRRSLLRCRRRKSEKSQIICVCDWHGPRRPGHLHHRPKSQHIEYLAALSFRANVPHVGCRPSSHGAPDSTHTRVPQPLLWSLSLRNKGHWNHERLFESGGEEAAASRAGQRSRAGASTGGANVLRHILLSPDFFQGGHTFQR